MDVVYKAGRTDICLPCDKSVINAKEIFMLVSETEGYSINEFYLTCNGSLISHSDTITTPCTVRSHIRVLGGKGGFGSMLRSLGARIEKTTNHEACRDLSGRRMRDVNNEKQIAEWLKEKEARDEERSKKRQEKLERILNPKFTYEDKGYTSNLQMNAGKVDDALQQALKTKKEKVGEKRKVDDKNQTRGKKTRLWMGADDDDIEEESDEDAENIAVASETRIDEDPVNQVEKKESPVKEDNRNESIPNLQTVTSEIDKRTDFSVKCETVVKQSVEESVRDDNNFSNLPTRTVDVAETDKYTDSSAKDEPTAAATQQHNKGEKVAQVEVQAEELDLSEYNSSAQLEAVGLHRLKTALMFLGLKCGGTLQDRARRLYLTKHTPLDQLDSSLFAKSSKKKKRK